MELFRYNECNYKIASPIADTQPDLSTNTRAVLEFRTVARKIYYCIGIFANMAFNIQISGPKLIMHHKTIAEMLMIQLNNNSGIFGVRNLNIV